MILKHDITTLLYVIYYVLFCVPFLFKPFYLFVADGSDSSGSTVPPSQQILGTLFFRSTTNCHLCHPYTRTMLFFFLFSQLECALNLHLICIKKTANWALDMVLFYALMRMLLIKLVKNCTIRSCCLCLSFLDFYAKLHQNKCRFATLQKMYANLVPKRC